MEKNKLHSNTAKSTLLKNRSFFVGHNIARLRDSIGQLPEKKKDLFYTIPFLLHTNSPGWPGFVDDAHVPHGIYRFFDSGFWRTAKEKLNIDHKEMKKYIPRDFFIKGVYLMRSGGMSGQTKHVALVYWVVVDENIVGATERGLLRKKFRLIEKWAKGKYNHQVAFFVLDAKQIKENDFSKMNEEGFGGLQRTVLKEEFYRNFIFISGQIPFC